jgi:tRNA-dihydrouridine synthase B
LILGNGDVTTRVEAETRATTYGVDGVLIGRATMGNPFVFRSADLHAVKGQPPASGASRAQIALDHAYLYEQTFRSHTNYRFLPMRKHLAWYIRDVRGGGHLRAQLVQSTSPQEAETLLRQHRTLTNGVYESLLQDKMVG